MKAFAFTDVMEPAGEEPLRVLARIAVVRTEDGGRSGPFTRGYRPNHNFGGAEDRVFFIGQIEVSEGIWVHPGETCDLPITFLNVRGLAELLEIGRAWRIQEGGKLVATATLLKKDPNQPPEPTRGKAPRGSS